ncbi:MAG TPA: hypothetical protein VIV40_24650 [Kofleriaceae bacterium]
MKRRLLVPMITAGVALASGIASANPTYWAQNGLLLEVSADPRDGTDFVQTNPVRAGRLELVALNDNVRLRGMTVHFSDGRTYSQQMNTIRPGERVMIDLPPNCGVIQSVELDYGRQIVDRTPARLQIIPHEDQRLYSQPVYERDHRRYSQYPRYQQPTYSYQQPTYSYQQPSYTYVVPRSQSYVVQPAPQTVGWSGSIQGSFRF